MIVVISPSHPFRGGIADTTDAFVKTLLEQGEKVTIISFSLLYPKLLFPGKTPYSSEKKEQRFSAQAIINTLNPLSWIRAAKQIDALKPKLVVFRYWTPWLAMCYATIAQRINTKKIAWVDNALPHERKIADKALLQYLLKRMDEVLCMSTHVATQLKKHTNVQVTKAFHPIHDGLPKPIEKKVALQQLGLDASKRYLLFFGLIRPYKGLDILIKAFPKILEKHPSACLLVVGEPYEPMRKYRELAASLNVSEAVFFHDRFVATDHIPHWFGACDWVIQPYKSATQSGITPMAIHYGRPSVVTSVGSLADGIEENIGLIAQPNPTSLAETINNGLAEKDRFHQKVLFEKIRHKKSWNTFCSDFIGNYLKN